MSIDADHRSLETPRSRTYTGSVCARWCALLLSLTLVFEPAAHAQSETTSPPDNATLQAQPAFSQQELDQMLAPIALYPDPLLSQILMASTYPLEVVEAARWSRANPGLVGDNAVRAAQQQDWDPSVKSLLAFPQILQMMDEKLEWTERMGDAFLAQEAQVMATVQNLRHKAYDAGNLSSNEQVSVETRGQTIVIVPANPEIVYVPYYDPVVVYGSWWWPDYPPIYWAPWPGYYYGPRYAPGFAWGFGITISSGFFFGGFDWPHHRVHVVNVNNYYYHGPGRHDRPDRPNVISSPGVWQHDPDHRRGVPYRGNALRQHDGRENAPAEARRDRRRLQPALPGERGTSASTPDTRTNGTRPNASGGRADRLYKRVPPSPPGAPLTSRRPPPESRTPAVEGTGRKAKVRNESGRDDPEGTPWRRRNELEQHSNGENSPEGRLRQPRQ